MGPRSYASAGRAPQCQPGPPSGLHQGQGGRLQPALRPVLVCACAAGVPIGPGQDAGVLGREGRAHHAGTGPPKAVQALRAALMRAPRCCLWLGWCARRDGLQHAPTRRQACRLLPASHPHARHRGQLPVLRPTHKNCGPRVRHQSLCTLPRGFLPRRLGANSSHGCRPCCRRRIRRSA